MGKEARDHFVLRECNFLLFLDVRGQVCTEKKNHITLSHFVVCSPATSFYLLEKYRQYKKVGVFFVLLVSPAPAV